MRKVVTDDDGAEWSFENFDGDRQRALCKAGQTNTFNSLQRVRVVKSMFRPYFINQAPLNPCRIHGSFFLNGFSSQVTVSGTKSTGEEVAKCVLDARQSPRGLPREFKLAEGCHPTTVTKRAKEKQPFMALRTSLSCN